MTDIHAGEVGLEIVITFLDSTGAALNLSDATTKQIIIMQPTGVIAKVAATVAGEFTNELHYTTKEDTFPKAGTYKIQGFAEKVQSSGAVDYRFYSDILEINVKGNLI